VYVRVVMTCPTCGMRVNGKRFSEVYPDLAPKAMFTVTQKGVKGLRTEVRDVASDPASQQVVASVEQALALSLLDTLSGYWEVYPWLREETLRKLRALVSPSELRILSPNRLVSPAGELRIPSPSRLSIQSPSKVTVGPWTKMGIGASEQVVSPSKSRRMESRSRLASSRTAPTKSSMPSPRAPGGVLSITSSPVVIRIESDSEVYKE